MATRRRSSHIRFGFKFNVYALALLLCASGLLIGLKTFSARAGQAQSSGRSSPDGVWQEIEPTGARRFAGVPAQARVVRLNDEALARVLNRAPKEDASLAEERAVLTLPLPDGSFARFRLEESPTLEPGLGARFPDLKSYRGFGLDDPAATMRAAWSPLGLHALVLTDDGAISIHPAQALAQTLAQTPVPVPVPTLDAATYVSYRGTVDRSAFACLTTEIHNRRPGDVAAQSARSPRTANGALRRTYRLAVATTFEYSALLGGGTNAGTVASINAWLVGINAIYERELAVRLLLVNNTDILYTAERGFNAGSDPFTDNNEDALLNEVRPVLRDRVGPANFDVGHVLAANANGGVAFVGVICDNADCNTDGRGPCKGGGVTPMGAPLGNARSLLVLAHELGHQFGANHSFNGTAAGCSGNARNAATAYETGSGSTIMSYAAICGTDDIVVDADLRFHAGSFAQIVNHIGDINQGGSCAVAVATGNTPPTVNGGADFTIPRNTPFTLTATGGDADAGDVPNLTYAWEQFDVGGTSFANPPYTDAGDAANTTRPIFRPFPPTSSPARTFPSLTYILNNANDPPDTINFGGATVRTAEELPRIGRALNFRVTARDGRGGVNDDSVLLNVDGASGPFTLASPNGGEVINGGTAVNIVWNVAGTNNAPVNAANVRILLSTDGGRTFPTVLAAATLNDGSEAITFPNGLISTRARVKIEAVGNIFFDVSNADLTIAPGDGCPALSGLSSLVGAPGTLVVIDGVNFTNVSTVRFNDAAGTGINATFTGVNDTRIMAIVPTGATSGPITLVKPGCADLRTPNFIVCTNPPTNLSVDDGVPDGAVAFGPGEVTYVNRLTPSGYAATATKVLVYFDSQITPVGTPISILIGTNTDGDANIDNTVFQVVNTTVQATGQFNEFLITPTTITSGDFVVGFRLSAQFQTILDTNAPLAGRSYRSRDGALFTNLNATPTDGNLPVRAQVIIGGCLPLPNCPTATGLSPTSGIVGSTVTINGSGFTGVSAVRLGNLPAAFTVVSDTQLTATVPAGATTAAFTIVKPNCPDTTTGTFTIAAPCPTITIAPSALPAGTAGLAYNQTLSATPASTYTFAVTSGAPPTGLTLNAAGTLSGTPTAGGTFSFTVTATDANNCTGNLAYTLTINCPTITLAPDALPGGMVGTAYNQIVTAAPAGTYSFAVTNGALPPGLTLSAAGAISGTPTANGAFNFTLTATGFGVCSGSRAYTINIGVNCPTITINPATLPAGTINVAYNQTLTATGGAAPYSFNLLSGVLPAGLSLASNGVLSGTPTTASTASIVIRVTDANGCGGGAQTYFITINSVACPTITINPALLPNGAPGVAYSQTLTATGGATPYTFSLLSGTLPTGLSLAANGVISGTPTTAGTASNIVIRATDANGCTSTQTYSITINSVACPTITINPPLLLNGAIGSFYSQLFTAEGGNGPYNFALAAGSSLPSSLTLANNTLSGTATAAGTFNFTLTATDANNCTGSRAYTLTINSNTTTTRLNADRDFSVFGQPVMFVATVTAVVGRPTGTVTFKDGAATLGTGTLNSAGQAGFNTAALAPGTHSIIAEYGGDGTFDASVSTAMERVVNKGEVNVTLASAIQPSIFGQPVTFTASVTAAAPAAGTPTGAITFRDGSVTICTTTLNGSGQAVCTAERFDVGVHTITVLYGGDANFNSGSPQPLAQTVNQANSTTAVASSRNPSLEGEAVTFSAAVSVVAPGSGTPTGPVIFRAGATTLCTVTLNTGRADCTTAALGVGAQPITAAYAGDANFIGSTSPTLVQTVNPRNADVAVAVTASPTTVANGARIVYTITVTNRGPAVATGVTITDNLAVLTFAACSATNGGVCNGTGNNRTVTFATLGVGVAATVRIEATVNCVGTNITSIANAVAVTTTSPDPNTADNAAAVSVAVTPGQLLLALGNGVAAFDFGSTTAGLASPLTHTFSLENTNCAPLTARLTINRTGADVTGGRITNTNDGALFPVNLINADGTETPLVFVNGGLAVELNGGTRARFRIGFNPQIPAPFGAVVNLAAGHVLPPEVTSTLSIAQDGGGARAVPLTGRIAGRAKLINPLATRLAPLVVLARIDAEIAVEFSLFDANLDAYLAGYQFLDAAGRPIGDTLTFDLVEPIRQSGVLRGQSFTVVRRFATRLFVAEPSRVRVTLYDREGSESVTSSELGRQAGRVVNVSAAAFAANVALSSEMITSAFGVNLAANTLTAPTGATLPTTLGGTRVFVRDSLNVERPAPLFFVAPGQINYQIPRGTATGLAVVTVARGEEAAATGTVQIAASSPGLFAANANGQGVASAVALRVRANGAQVYEPVAQFDPALNRFTARAIDLGPESEQVFVVLFATGLRNRNSPLPVLARIGGVEAQVLFAGPQGGLIGVDQVNVRVPRSLLGRGEVEIVLNVDGRASNAVTVRIR